MNKQCYIFGAGEYPQNVAIPGKLDIIIACDAGYAKLEKMGIHPTLTVGDFDSLNRIPSENNVIIYPSVKDETDMALAIKHGIELGATSFIIYGALGGRLDHTIANMHIIADLAIKGINAVMIGKRQTVSAVHNGTVSIKNHNAKYASVFAWGTDAHGVTLSGFKYELTDGELTTVTPLGVSNEISADEATITVNEGTLIVILEY